MKSMFLFARLEEIMAKYRYRIDGGRYGGECAVGTVSEDFAQYWTPKIEEDGAHSCGSLTAC